MGLPVRSPLQPGARRRRAAARGFSLIELLVAMAVLAALAAISFRGLNSILDAEARVQSETRRWNDVAAVVAHLGRDLSLAAARPARDGTGRLLAALTLEGPKGDSPDQLVVTRLGDGDNGTALADPRRIGYRLRAGTLEYLVWPSADAAPDAVPATHVILENVAQLNLRALGPDGAWVTAWPGEQPVNALPRAIEAQFVLAGGERITRLFPLR